MLNMLCTAVRLGYMSIDKVPSAFQAEVKKDLGIQDVIGEQPVEESPVETTEQPTVSK